MTVFAFHFVVLKYRSHFKATAEDPEEENYAMGEKGHLGGVGVEFHDVPIARLQGTS